MKTKENAWKNRYLQKVIDPQEIEDRLGTIRKNKKSVATLNGSFDLLHAGHLEILFEASKAADVLIVALNSDSSIKKYKSPDRPIIPLEYRLQMVAALEFVDYVTWFNETDPIALLERIRPDIHVNGAEYGENCLEAEMVKKYGGALKIVDLIPGLSTSQIISRIKNLQA